MLTIVEARKQVKAGMREWYAWYTGSPAWWESKAASTLRKMVASRSNELVTRVVLTQQAEEGKVMDEVKVEPTVAEPSVPASEPEAVKSPADEAMEALRAMARAKYPTPSGLGKKEDKKRYHQRRQWLIAQGAPKRGLLPGQVVFGKKLG